MKLTYRQFADHLKQRARQRHAKMRDPEDCWPSEATFVLPDEIRNIPIDPLYFSNRLAKRVMVQELLVPAIKVGKARMFGYQGEFYALREDHPVAQETHSDEYDPAGIPDYGTVPGHLEFLNIGVWDAERAEMWSAEITRPESGPPKLGPWQVAENVWGPMFDPIAEAMR